jgi:hypothetical protein
MRLHAIARFDRFQSALILPILLPAQADPLVRGGDVQVILQAPLELGLIAVLFDNLRQIPCAPEGGIHRGLRNAAPCGPPL